MSTGLHARRATWLAGAGELELYPKRIGGEVVARGAGSVQG